MTFKAVPIENWWAAICTLVTYIHELSDPYFILVLACYIIIKYVLNNYLVSKVQKAFKVTLIPSHNQEVLIHKTIGCARFVYNRFLALRKELYDTEKKTLNYNGCSQQLTLLKKEIDWLREVDKFALQNSLKNLDTAYKNFFADLKKVKSKKGVGFPKFKKKYGCK